MRCFERARLEKSCLTLYSPLLYSPLLEEFLKPLGVTQYRLAKEIGVPQRRIGEIVAGKRSITADTAARLGVY